MTTSAPSAMQRMVVLASVVSVGVIVDQLTKLWAEANVRGHGVLQVIDGFFDLRFARNRGAFFSMGSKLPDGVRLSLFLGVALFATAWMVKLHRESLPEQRRLRAALACLISGALGNLIDRVRQGEVTDFLHLHFGELFHWATFNAADIYITAGLVLLIPELFSSPRSTAQSTAAPSTHP